MVHRRWVLGGATVAAVLTTAVLLFEVVATVFFAITVAYVLSPVRRRLRSRGFSRRLAAGVASFAGFAAAVAVLAPLVVVLIVRIDEAIAFLESIPETATVSAFGYRHTIVTEDVTTVVVEWLVTAGTAVATATPVLLIKLLLFAFVVYGLLYHERRTRRAIFAMVPADHRPIVEAVNIRANRTLYGLYVVQAATGFATFLIAVPVFMAFGYTSPITLATLAGILQFIPVLGPSVLIIGLTGYELFVGDPTRAVTVLLVCGTFIAAAPDVLIRPRLAARTAEIGGTLYFIGFVGGILTIGPIGIIAGPLAIAIVAELGAQLSNELNRVEVTEEPSLRSTLAGSNAGPDGSAPTVADANPEIADQTERATDPPDDTATASNDTE